VFHLTTSGKSASSLHVTNRCLLYGSQLIVPRSLPPQVLQLLHLRHFGIQRIKRLVSNAVHRSNNDCGTAELCRHRMSCSEQRNQPAKAPSHPWTFPEKPWSRPHVDDDINTQGGHWPVEVDAYSKHPTMYPRSSTAIKATATLLKEDYAHFGNPYTIVTENATCFISDHFQA